MLPLERRSNCQGSKMSEIKSNFFKSYGKVYDFMEIIFCVHAFVKSTIQYVSNKANFCVNLAAVLLTPCVLISFGGVILITFVCAKTVDLILRIKMGEKYGGRLGEDSLHIVTQTPCFVTFLLVFSYDGNGEDFRVFVKQRLSKFHNGERRFSFTVQKYLGYSYYVKSRGKIDEVVEEIDFPDADNLSKEALFSSLLKDCDEPLDTLWNAKIVSLPDSGKHGKICPVIIKYHHVIADGVSFLSQLGRALGEVNPRLETINPGVSFDCKEISNILQDTSSLTKKRIHYNPLMKGKRNIRSEKTTRMALYCEEEGNEKYMGLIKRIKGRFEGMTFTEVLVTAFTSSFYDYCSQMGECNEELNFAVMSRPRCDANLNFHRGIYDSYHFGNKAIMDCMLLPSGKFSRISERLLGVHEKWKPKNVLDTQMMFWFKKVLMSHWPDWIVKFNMSVMGGVDLGVTNLPGIKLKNLSQAKLQDFFFYVPMMVDEHFKLFVGTQDERFHVLLTAHDARVSNEDLRNILSKTFSYLDVLDEETKISSASDGRGQKVEKQCDSKLV